jgi:hypothetical protein
MEIQFQDSDQTPLPPEEMRVEVLKVTPWTDGRRVTASVEITPFQERPNVHVRIYNEQGEEVAATAAIQALQTQFEFTLYLYPQKTQGRYRAEAHVAYPHLELDELGRMEAGFEIPPASQAES